jgi:tryprostatin B 6-hydroxylase
MLELRIVTASLVQKFDISFAPGMEGGMAVTRDMKDQFTATPGKLEVVFRHRRD